MRPIKHILEHPGQTQMDFHLDYNFSFSLSGEFSGNVRFERKVDDEYNLVRVFDKPDELNGSDFVGNEYRVTVEEGLTGSLKCVVKKQYKLGVNGV